MSVTNILVLGNYGTNSFGDDLFQYVLRHTFGSTSVRFAFVDPLAFVNQGGAPNTTDMLFVGGGDLINTTFLTPQIESLITQFEGPKYALSVDVDDLPLIDTFDKVLLRGSTDVSAVATRIGFDNVTWLPDMTVLSPTAPEIIKKNDNAVLVGVFISTRILGNTETVDGFAQALVVVAQQLPKIKYLLVPSTTGPADDSDVVLAADLVTRMALLDPTVSSRVTYEIAPPLPDEVSLLFRRLDFAVCMQFQAVVLSMLHNVPLFVVHSGNKLGCLIRDYDLQAVAMNVAASGIDQGELTSALVSAIQKSDAVALAGQISAKSQDLLDFIGTLIVQKPVRETGAYRLTDDRRTVLVANAVAALTTQTGGRSVRDAMAAQGLRFVPQVWAQAMTYSITGDPKAEYVFGLRDQLLDGNPELLASWIVDDYYILGDGPRYMATAKHRRFVVSPLDGPTTYAGFHRSGWAFALQGLQRLSDMTPAKVSQSQPILVDGYLDRTFGWDSEMLSAIGAIPYTSPWVGFLHHTFNLDYSHNNAEAVVKDSYFLQSLPTCRGLFVLSETLAAQLRLRLPSTPVYSLVHPTETPTTLFSLSKFLANTDRKVVQVGAWLRDTYGIYRLAVPDDPYNYQRVTKGVLKGFKMDHYFEPTGYLDSLTTVPYCEGAWLSGYSRGDPTDANTWVRGMFQMLMEQKNAVTVYDRLNNEDYDLLLSQNLVFLNLIDCSACNTLVECFVRNTPVLVNPLPAVVELLGHAYPGYYTTYYEASKLLEKPGLVLECFLYLQNMDKTVVSLDSFCSSFARILDTV